MSRIRRDEQGEGWVLPALIVGGLVYWFWPRGEAPPAGPGALYEQGLALDLASRLDFGAAGGAAGLSPWLEPSAGAQPFIAMNTGTVTIPAIGAETTVVTFTVPRRKNGLIQFIATQFVGGGWTQGSGDLVWRLEADTVPIQGYNNIIASIGNMSAPADLGSSPILVYENQVIRLQVRNVAVPAAGQILLGMLRGRFFPIEQAGADTWQ